jgi:hypothetical protein
MNCRSGLTEGMVLLTRVMKRLMESELMPAPSFFLGMKDSLAYVSCLGARLVWGGRVGIGVASVGDGWSVELDDVEDVVGANCCNGLGGAGKCNGCAIVVGVGSTLGASVVAGVGRSGVLGEMFNLHCRCEKIFDVSGEDGFDLVMDGGLDGGFALLLYH